VLNDLFPSSISLLFHSLIFRTDFLISSFHHHSANWAILHRVVQGITRDVKPRYGNGNKLVVATAMSSHRKVGGGIWIGIGTGTGIGNFFYCVGIIESHWFRALYSSTRVDFWEYGVTNCHAMFPKVYEGNFIFCIYKSCSLLEPESFLVRISQSNLLTFPSRFVNSICT